MSATKHSDEKLLINLEEYVQEIDPEFELVGNGDIDRISSILGQSHNHNIIYAGPSGVGKTATIHGIARRKHAAIEDLEKVTETGLPLHMVDRRFMLLDVNALFDNDGPEVIARDIELIFQELDGPGNHVLIIEDVGDMLKGIEDQQAHGFLSKLMRELKRDNFQTIWMVRDEASKGKLAEVLDCHSDVRELFTVVEKEEPPKEEVLDILDAYKTRLEKHFDGLEIEKAAVEEIVNLTAQYPSLRVWTRKDPARSLSFLDRAASSFVSRGQTCPPELVRLEKELAGVQAKLEADPSDALRSSERELQGQVDELTEGWKKQAQELYKVQALMRKHQDKLETAQRKLSDCTADLKSDLRKEHDRDPTKFEMDQATTGPMREANEAIRKETENLEKIVAKADELKRNANTQLVLERADIQAFFSELSGVPVADLDGDETDKILNLGDRIKEKVFGQDEAVDYVTGTIQSAKAGLKGSKRPMGVFICLGSSGVGKSYLAEIAAEALFGDKDAMTPFDMSEFMEKHTVSMLKGAPPGYAGYGQGGRLTNAVRRTPYQAILLDEVEKAHPDVFKILLQVCNDGRLSDELGSVKFNNTVLFLTTNIGQELALEGKIDPESPEGRQAIISKLREFFPQELLNRVDGFLLFNPLADKDIEMIVKRDIADLNQSEALMSKNITVDLPEEDIAALVADKYRVEEGARQVQKFIENRLSPQFVPILLRHRGEGGTIHASYDATKDDFNIDFVPSDGSALEADVNKPVPQLKVVAGQQFNPEPAP